MEVALLCDGGERERWLVRPQKAGKMAGQVLGKPLEAFQPNGVFTPVHLSAAAETNACPVWGEGRGAKLGPVGFPRKVGVEIQV